MAWYDELVGDIKTALDAVYAPLSHNHNSLYYTKAEVDALIGGGTVTTISLTADTNILSYYNSQSATLSATVLENGSPKESATVEFFKGATSLGTATTDSNGIATKTYASTGAGDVSFTASVGSLVSETYAIEDCFYWNATGLTYTSNSNTDRKVLTGLEDTLEFTPNGNFEFSYTEADTGVGKRLYLISKPQSTSTTNKYGIGGDIDTNSVAVTLRTTITDRKPTNDGKVSPSSFKFIIDGTNVEGYINGTLKNTWTNVNWWSTYAPYTLSYAIWGTGTGTWTNIKIKPL